MKRIFFFIAFITLALSGFLLTAPSAQMRVVPLDDEKGHVALGLALRHLGNTGIFMNATAHPDDEDNGLLVMLNRGLGYRTALATATRGNGGQNEIGPEIFEALGVLRTEELAAVHRFDGAEQYFTRAVDFGFSFSIEETFEKWGRPEILGDFVRLIRMVRPDVILTLRPAGNGGGQHHEASAVIAREAFSQAGDPAKFPEQLKDGLRPWQPKKLYTPAENGAARAVTIDLASYDRLLGKTYAEIGVEARSMHKCQGMGQLLALSGPSADAFQLVESTIPGQMQRDERSLFDSVDSSIAGLAQFVGPRPPRELTESLSAITSAIDAAQKRFDTDADQATLLPLLNGLRAVRVARAQLRTPAINDTARFEIEFRLRQKEREFQQAILLAGGLRVDALADDGVVVPGQAVKVSVVVANHGIADVAVKQVKFDGFDGEAACTLGAVTSAGGGRGRGRGAAQPAAEVVSTLRKDQVARCDPELRVKSGERTTEPYWHRSGEAGRYTFDPDAPFGLPYRPTPFYVQVTLAFAGAANEEVFAGTTVQHRYQGDIFSGEKRSDLLVVPALSVRVSPEVAIVPIGVEPAAPAAPAPGRGPVATTGRATTPPGRSGAPARGGARGRGAAVTETPAPVVAAPPGRDIRVTVVNDAKGSAESAVKLTLPDGWVSTPPQQTVAFTREDESQTVRFQVRPPAGAKAGEFTIGAVATRAGQEFSRGFQTIEYPHTRRQLIYHENQIAVHVMDVKIAPNLAVGYIMGAGDEVPAAIEQLGVKVEQIGADDLAWGDLSRFHTIVTGVRAYERRADLRANNDRLIEYVLNGGTMIVQYNKLVFNEAQYGPWPAQVSNDRVTDENAPINILARGDPVFTMPNEITAAAWSGWVQERGLYFLGEKDSRYRDLVSLSDPFPNNPGEKTGALVQASYGKGRWVYVGLGLWRELPAGVPGAYQLLANLISLKGS